MKSLLSIVLIIVSGTALGAQAKPVESRVLTQFGAMLTMDESGDPSHWGGGFAIRNYHFFDPTQPEGFYYGLFSGAFAHSAGGISIADARLVTLGWRGDPARFWHVASGIQVDLGAAPTLGTRVDGNTILGSYYTAAGFTVGLGYPIGPWGDLGIAWEPTVNVTTWGAPSVPQKTYSDFMLTWTMKTHQETKNLPWD